MQFDSIRPFQINFLFPVHRPHLVTVSSKTSIIPYSSIISGYSCILTGSVKAISKRYQLSAIKLAHMHFTFVLFLQLKKEGTSLSMLLCSFLWLCQVNNGLKSCQSQGRSQDFLKGSSSTSIELPEAGVWGCSPQPPRNFQYFNESKLSKLLYFMQKVH